MTSKERILVTGASGQLGRLVVKSLLARTSADRIVALARNPASVADLAAAGVEIRAGDYDRPADLVEAFAGVRRVLLISSNEIGRRAAQHQAVIDAAKAAGVGFLAYTSVLHADVSALGLAEEHRQTEAALGISGLPYAVLRNGWYTENYTASIPAALAHGALLGSAGAGRISSAARADYAEAAAAVLLDDATPSGEIFELAGDEAYTLSDFAAEIGARAGRTIGYVDLPEADYRKALIGAGLPEPVAALLSDSDAAAAKGALFDDSRRLSALIGRPTTPWRETITTALSK